MLLAASVGWASIQGGRLLLSPLLSRITVDLGITGTRAGLALTVLWGLYALLPFPGGRLSDRLPWKTLLVAGVVLGWTEHGERSSAGCFRDSERWWCMAGSVRGRPGHGERTGVPLPTPERSTPVPTSSTEAGPMTGDYSSVWNR